MATQSKRARALALANPKRLVDTPEAATLTGLTETTLVIYRSVGKLPADVTLTREQWMDRGRPRARVYYRVSTLIAFMKQTRPSYPRSRT